MSEAEWACKQLVELGLLIRSRKLFLDNFKKVFACFFQVCWFCFLIVFDIVKLTCHYVYVLLRMFYYVVGILAGLLFFSRLVCFLRCEIDCS